MRSKETAPIPVRIPVDYLPRLDVAADKIGTSRGKLLMICIRAFLEDFEAHGVTILPPNYKVLFRTFDGRTTEGKRELLPAYPQHQTEGLLLNEKLNSSAAVIAAVDAASHLSPEHEDGTPGAKAGNAVPTPSTPPTSRPGSYLKKPKHRKT